MEADAYVVNVDAALVRDGEYLLIQRGADESHAAGLLAFPGGKVELEAGVDDAIEATARRELREEVGVEAGAVEYVCSSTFESDGGTPCLNVVTRCAYAGGDPYVAEPDEVATVHWLTAPEISDHPDAPPYLEAYVEQVEARRP